MSLPRQRSKIGTFKILAVSIKWSSQERFASRDDLTDMMKGVSNTYLKCSRNLFKIDYKIQIYHTDEIQLSKVENEIKNKNPDYHYYIIVNNLGSKYTDHAGSKIAHVKSTLIRTASHELGHLLGLKDANKYNYETDKFEQYGDNLSFMGRFASNELTAPALYKLGWIPKREVVLLRINGKYRLKNLFNKELNYYSCIILPRQNTEDFIFISYQDNSICLHLGKNGQSQKIKQIGNEPYHDKIFSNLYIEQIEKEKDYVIISIKKY